MKGIVVRYRYEQQAEKVRPVRIANTKPLKKALKRAKRVFELGDQVWVTGRMVSKVIGINALYEPGPETPGDFIDSVKIPGDMISDLFLEMGLKPKMANDLAWFKLSDWYAIEESEEVSH